MRTKTGYRCGDIGAYSGGDPREASVAWKALQFEACELGNEQDNTRQVARFLGIKPSSWKKVLAEFRKRYGNAKGIWLTRTKEDAALYKEYGGVEKVPYREVDIIIDLGPDGIYVLDRRGQSSKPTAKKAAERGRTEIPPAVRGTR